MNKDTIRSTVKRIAQQRQTVSERVRSQLDIINNKNPQLNALAYVHQDAVKEASELDKQILAKTVKGSLLGTTFSTRLSIEVAGTLFSNGSIIDQPSTSSKSHFIIEKLLKHGALCLGKGNIAERGRSYYSENPRFGRTNHPVDQNLSPGGSGGGDAAAIVAGFVDFAIGADAGGSVRVPANFCGLFSISPTHGVFSEQSPSQPTHTIIRLLKTFGIMSRSLDDLEIIYSLLEGYDPLDPYSVDTYISSRPNKKRFLVCETINGTTPCSEILTALKECESLFIKAGYNSETKTPDYFHSLTEPYVVLAGQAQLILEDQMKANGGLPLELEKEGKHLKFLRKRIAEELPPLSVEKLLSSWQTVDIGRHKAAQTMSEYDFILLPVAATLPVAHDTGKFEINGKIHRSEEVYQFATLINALGLPAITIPTGRTDAGIPIGIQIVGPRFQERFLFQLLRGVGFS